MVKTVHSPIIRRAVVIDVKISPLKNETRKFNKNLSIDTLNRKSEEQFCTIDRAFETE